MLIHYSYKNALKNLALSLKQSEYSIFLFKNMKICGKSIPFREKMWLKYRILIEIYAFLHFYTTYFHKKTINSEISPKK